MTTRTDTSLADSILAMNASSALAEPDYLAQVIKGWTIYGYDDPLSECSTALEVAGWLAAYWTVVREGWLDREHCYDFGIPEVQELVRWMRSDSSREVLVRNGILSAAAA
jgi:hypothetical protein